MALAKPWSTFIESITNHVSGAGQPDQIQEELEHLINTLFEVPNPDIVASDYKSFQLFIENIASEDITQFFDGSTEENSPSLYFTNNICPDLVSQIKSNAEETLKRFTNLDSDTENDLNAWEIFISGFESDIRVGVEELIKKLRKSKFVSSTVLQLKNISSLVSEGSEDLESEIFNLDQDHPLKVALASRILIQLVSFYRSRSNSYSYNLNVEYDNSKRAERIPIDIELDEVLFSEENSSLNETEIGQSLGQWTSNEFGSVKIKYQVFQHEDVLPEKVKLKLSSSGILESPVAQIIPLKPTLSTGNIWESPYDTRSINIGSENVTAPTTVFVRDLIGPSNLNLSTTEINAIKNFINTVNESDNGIQDIFYEDTSEPPLPGIDLKIVREIGGLQNMNEFWNLDSNTDTVLIKNIRLIDRHAFYEGINVDLSVAKEIAPDKDSMDLDSFSNAGRSKVVEKIANAEDENDFTAIGKNDGITSAINITKSVVAQVLSENAMTDSAPVISGETGSLADPNTYNRVKTLLTRIYMQKCNCKDSETAVSPLAYLLDLLHYSVQHVTKAGTPRVNIDLNYLTSNLHQKFDELPAEEKSLAESVSQARLSTEVLISKNEGILSASEISEYLEAVYNSLLSYLGTNQTQLFDAIGNIEKKKSLCQKLGLKYDPKFDIIELLYLKIDASGEKQLSEQNLDQLIGLQDISQDPLSRGFKSNDGNNDIAHWSFENVKHGINTNTDGTVELTIDASIPYEVTVSVNSVPVGKGEIGQGTGDIALIPEGINGISGVIQIDDVQNDVTEPIIIQVIPKLLAAQLLQLKSTWLSNDEQPIIDPDSIFPDDFADPMSQATNSAIGIYKSRKKDLKDLREDLSETTSSKFNYSTINWNPKVFNNSIPTAITTPITNSEGACKDSKGNLYIANATNIIVLDKELNYDSAKTINSALNSDLNLQNCRKVDYSTAHDLLCFGDYDNHFIAITDISGKETKIKIIEQGTTEGQIDAPSDVGFLKDGTIILRHKGGDSDRKLAKIQKPKVQFIPSFSNNASGGVDQYIDSSNTEYKAIAFPQAKKVVILRNGENIKVLSGFSNVDGVFEEFTDPVDVAFNQYGILFVLDKSVDMGEGKTGGIAIFNNTFDFLKLEDLGLSSENALSIAVSKKVDTHLIYISIENDTKILVFEYDEVLFADNITEHATWSPKNINTGTAGKLACHTNGALFVTDNNDKIAICPDGLEDDFSTFITDSESNPSWVNFVDNQGSLEGVFYSSSEGTICKTDFNSNTGTKIAEWKGRLDNWMDSENVGAVFPVDAEKLEYDFLGNQSTLYKVFQPVTFFNQNTDVLWDILISKKEERIYAGSFDNIVEIDLNGNILKDFKALNPSLSFKEVKSMSEDEFGHIYSTNRDSPSATHIYIFNQNGELMRDIWVNSSGNVSPNGLSNMYWYVNMEGGKGAAYSTDSQVHHFDMTTKIGALIESFTTNSSTYGLSNPPFSQEDFLQLRSKELKGDDISPILEQYYLTYSEFRYLVNILNRELQHDNFPTGEDWWDQAKDILINVYKKATAFEWMNQENENEIFISSSHFNLINDTSEQSKSFNRWRSSIAKRTGFRNKLKSRIIQERNIIEANAHLIMDIEKEHMPVLRDLYINELDIDSLELENTLLIDMHSSGEVRNNRITQATTTLQNFLWGIRNGFFENTDDLNVDSDYFEKEWGWLGTYASWRAAMFVFLYPENLLAPQYKRLFSPRMRSLTNSVLNSRRFSQKNACEVAQDYVDYLNEVKELRSVTGIYTKISIRDERKGCQTERTEFERVLTLGATPDNKFYYSLQHPLNSTIDEFSIWKELPEITFELDFIGTIKDQIKNRILFLWHEKSELNKLKGVYYNQVGDFWDEDFSEIPLPNISSWINSSPNYYINSSSYGQIRSTTSEQLSVYRFYRFIDSAGFGSNYDVFFALDINENNVEWKLISKPNKSNTFVPIESIPYTIISGYSKNEYIYIYATYLKVDKEILWTNLYFQSSDPPQSGGVKDLEIDGSPTGIQLISHDTIFFPTGKVTNSGNITEPKGLILQFTGDGQFDDINPTMVDNLPEVFWWHHPVYNDTTKNFFTNKLSLFHHGRMKLAMFSLSGLNYSHIASRYITPSGIGQLNINENLSEKPQVEDEKFKKRDSYDMFYTEEAFLHVPILIAEKLRDLGIHNEALKWYALVYNYKTKNPVYKGLKFANSNNLYSKDETWLKDPLNPHGIAKTRNQANRKYIIASITKCLLANADKEFVKDSSESVEKSKELYKEALELLKTVMDIDPISNCGTELQSETISLEPQVSHWQSLVSSILGLLNLIQNSQQIIDLKSDTIWSNLKNAFVGIITDETIQSPIANLLNRVLSEVYGQTGIQQFRYNDHLSQLGHSFNAASLAVQSAIDVTDLGRQTYSSAQVNTQRAIQETYLVEDVVFDDPGSITSTPDWTRSESIQPPKSRDFEGTALKTISPTPVRESIIPPIGHDDEFMGGERNTAETTTDPISIINENSNNGGKHYYPIASFAFCVPKNPIFESLALSAQLNLFKIYSGRSISGFERQLDPFSAPINATSGIPGINGTGGSSINDIGVLPGIYRFSYLLEKAKEQANYAYQMEQAFLTLLEKYDAVSFSIFQAEQNLNLSSETVRLQDIRLKEANQGIELANTQLERSNFSKNHFTSLLDKGLLASELDSLKFLKDARSTSDKITSLNKQLNLNNTSLAIAQSFLSASTASAAGLATALVSATAYSFTAMQNLYVNNDITNAQGKIQDLQFLNQIASLQSSFTRRFEEWSYQEGLSDFDIQLSNINLNISQTRVEISSQEKRISELQNQFAKDTLEFLKDKFTSVELYAWMAGVMEGVYSYFLSQATATAKMAYYQLGFERQQIPYISIREDYWNTGTDASGLSTGLAEEDDTDRKGLTGAARLQRDIIQLEQEAIESDQRKLQLSKTISLSKHDPNSFQTFKQTGILPFVTRMELFDRDFPGHMMRLVKRVSVTVLALTPSIDGIKASLSASSNSKIVKGELYPTLETIKRPSESISFTNAIGASGLFELQTESNKLMPFEGMGVEALWFFEMQRASNQMNYNSIADILITIDYTAINNFNYKQKVIQDLGNAFSSALSISFKNNLPDQWFDLNSELNLENDELEVSFKIYPGDFPPNLSNISITDILIAFEENIEESSNEYQITISKQINTSSGAIMSSNERRISTSTNSTALNSFLGNVEDEMAFVFTIKSVTKGNNSTINGQMLLEHLQTSLEDIIIILSFSAETPNWN